MASKQPTVLVVEDDPSNAKMLHDLLELHGYRVEVAANGEAGLAQARAWDIDLVLLDVMLPDLNGLEVCRSLRAIQTAPYLPVVMLTCRSQPNERDQAFAAGADDYLTRPIEIDKLMDFVGFWTCTSQEIKSHWATPAAG
jgi:DNA-binding response OmpR family regulator